MKRSETLESDRKRHVAYSNESRDMTERGERSDDDTLAGCVSDDGLVAKTFGEHHYTTVYFTRPYI